MLATGSCTIAATVKVLIPGAITNTATGNRALTGQNSSASVQVVPPDGSFQVRYASNLTTGESTVNLVNNGANGVSLKGPGFGGAAGNLCVNAYTFSPDEQLVACCSCLITPNGLASIAVGERFVEQHAPRRAAKLGCGEVSQHLCWSGFHQIQLQQQRRAGWDHQLPPASGLV